MKLHQEEIQGLMRIKVGNFSNINIVSTSIPEVIPHYRLPLLKFHQRNMGERDPSSLPPSHLSPPIDEDSDGEKWMLINEPTVRLLD